MKKMMTLNTLLFIAIFAFVCAMDGPDWSSLLCALIGGVCIGVYNLMIVELIKKGGQDESKTQG